MVFFLFDLIMIKKYERKKYEKNLLLSYDFYDYYLILLLYNQ